MMPSTTRVVQVNPQAVEHYKAMRGALLGVPGADKLLCEIVVTSQLALLGHEVPFKIHATKLFESQVSREQLEQVILAGLGVTFVIPQAARVLDWIAHAHDVRRADGAINHLAPWKSIQGDVGGLDAGALVFHVSCQELRERCRPLGKKPRRRRDPGSST
ncbi:hypothetical protein LP414_07765 [Polaromonas sp. P1(28)-13]|nr:hypothetical protein LP414_07765 [Polaromonas sp. P1(28)-13]